VSVVSCLFPNSITTTRCQQVGNKLATSRLRGSYGEMCVMDFGLYSVSWMVHVLCSYVSLLWQHFASFVWNDPPPWPSLPSSFSQSSGIKCQHKSRRV